MTSVRPAACAAACAAGLLLAACGGGGGGSGTPSLPATASTPAAQSPSGPTAQATFRIDVSSAAAPSSSTRSPKYVSPATQSVSVALQGQSSPLAVANLTPTSPGCTSSIAGTSCTVNVTAPIGSDTFTVTAFAGTNGTGSVLSTATVVQTIALNATNTVPLVLNGVVSTAAVILGSTSVPAGTPATVAVTVVAYDAAGEIIIGPGNYTTAVTLTDTDPTGNTALSTNSVQAPGTNATLSYNGGSLMGATITPAVGGTPGTAATFAPAGAALTTYLLPASITGANAMSGGPVVGVWVASNDNSGVLGWIGTNGAATVFSTGNGLPNDYFNAVAPDKNGNEWFGGGDDEVGSVTVNGTVTLASNFTTPCESSATTCGQINSMAMGLDGNVWFSDQAQYIGRAGSAGVTEWDPTQLPGWPGGATLPEQVAFDQGGNLYVADFDQQSIYKVSIGSTGPTSVVALSSVGCGVVSVAAGTDGNVWFSDVCENLYAVPTANFTSGAIQSWSISGLTNDNIFDALVATPGGVWTTDDVTSVYRISNTAAAGSPAQPAISTLQPFASPDLIALGGDGNVWVAGDVSGGCGPLPIQPLARITYGVPRLGAQSVARNLPKAVRRSPSGKTPWVRRRPKGGC